MWMSEIILNVGVLLVEFSSRLPRRPPKQVEKAERQKAFATGSANKGAGKTYALLREALARSGKVGVA